MKTDLKDLIERLEKATGPHRDLDRAIALACGALHFDEDRGRLYEDHRDGTRTYGGLGDDIMIRHFTASLDAIVDLIERVSPGAMWQIGFDPDDGSMLGRIVTAAPACRHGKANHEEPAIALCLALLKSLD